MSYENIMKNNKKQIILVFILILLILSNIFVLIPFDFNNGDLDVERYNPKGIRITTFQNLNGTVLVSWFTEENSQNPIFQYSSDQNFSDNNAISARYFNIDGTFTYSVILNDLIPNSTYYYRIKSDSQNYGESRMFKSLPVVDSANFSFIVYGDSRTLRAPRSELTNKISDFSLIRNLDFSIHSGDIVEDGRIQSQWDNYFIDTEILYSKIPGIFVEGNHEGGLNTLMYENFFPGVKYSQRYYSFIFGNCGFIILNSNGYYDVSIEEEQKDWLNQTLYEYSQLNEYNFVFLHHPLLHNRTKSYLRDDWPPLFERYNVTCVFCGHNHNYERSYPIINQTVIDEHTSIIEYNATEKYNYRSLSDPIYIVSGGAGAPLYNIHEYDFIAYTNSTYHFCMIDIERIINDTSISIEVWAMPEVGRKLTLIDNITIVI
jgi:hypothetical protein